MPAADQNVHSTTRTNGALVQGADALTVKSEADVSAAAAPASPSPERPPANADRTMSGLTEKVRRETAVLRNALAFTQILGVLMRSPHYRQCAIGDLEWLVIPPLMAGQFRIGEAPAQNGQGPTLPVALVLWASVSAEVDQRLMDNPSAFQIKPEDWTSGDILWLMHAAGETRFVRFIVEQLKKTTLKDRKIKVLARDKDGNAKARLLEEPEDASSRPQ
jgi:hemolysin-activating ACP:hemolysin acyltransferase